jgi:hypothetical protein
MSSLPQDYLKHTRHKGVKRFCTYNKDADKQTRSESKNYAHWKWQFDQIKALHQKGYSFKAFASTLKMAHSLTREFRKMMEQKEGSSLKR